MLGYSFDRLHKASPGPEWNMAYEVFCIHARVIYDFLRNDGHKNDFKAVDYTETWRPGTNTKFNDIDSFIAHLSKQRETRAKLTLEVLRELGAWLDKEWERWVAALSEEDAALVNPSPVCVPSKVLLNGITQHTACTAVIVQSFAYVPPVDEA